MQIGVSNPNVPIFPPRVCTLVLFIVTGFGSVMVRYHFIMLYFWFFYGTTLFCCHACGSIMVRLHYVVLLFFVMIWFRYGTIHSVVMILVRYGTLGAFQFVNGTYHPVPVILILDQLTVSNPIPYILFHFPCDTSPWQVFVCGPYTHWIFLSGRGGMYIHPMYIDGPVTCFAPFHNVNCPHGFLYFNAEVCTIWSNLYS